MTQEHSLTITLDARVMDALERYTRRQADYIGLSSDVDNQALFDASLARDSAGASVAAALLSQVMDVAVSDSMAEAVSKLEQAITKFKTDANQRK